MARRVGHFWRGLVSKTAPPDTQEHSTPWIGCGTQRAEARLASSPAMRAAGPEKELI